MANTVHIKMMDKDVEIDLLSNNLTLSTVKSQFLLPWDAVVSLSYEVNSRQKGCEVNENGSAFILPADFSNMQFSVESDKTPSRPASSMDVRPNVSPYPDAPSPPPPLSKSIDKWMFYASDLAGKSTVVCVHPRYFVTFRHGTHLLLQLGSAMKIFHATAEDQPNAESGWEVTVVDINEKLDFILLRSKENIVETAPRLVGGEESEIFLLAGFGDMTSGSQKLAYLSGIVHSVRGYYFSLNDRPSPPLMGPFYLGTGQSSRGDSGGACWSSRGLIGIKYGVTCMPDVGFTHFVIHEAATYSPKTIISPAVRFEESLMAQLRIEQQNSPKTPPSKKKLIQTEIEGLGSQTLFIDEARRSAQ
ncbi:unnamed protein product [Caenorhabditis auriculariae]|uniref:Uncharacterized protein n=1 Tax=Caenorhabditis auriculariae TaxID=2777116 RepID=A0A8S1HRW5_9PELO|nr:unnamed protein product [Caenorhabditis auriculariae]